MSRRLRTGIAAAGLFAIVAGCKPTHPAKPTPTPTPSPKPTPEIVEVTPTPEPSPTPIYVPSRRTETAKMFNGLKINATVKADFGTTATVERTTPESYALNIEVDVKVPYANQSLEELAKVTPKLPAVLPSLANLLPTAKVDPFFDDLYRRKVAVLNHDLPRLYDLLSRHNFYDCETILQFEDPTTKRKALLIQADMDIVMDGSDSDRVPSIDGSSTFFQPTTSYKWPKRTAVPNPFLAAREQRLKQAETDLAAPGVDSKKAQEIKRDLPRLRAEVDELKKYSYLIATTDPFIVVPLPLYSAKSPFAPKIGDYCVVIFEDVLYPAIVGDVGPTYKTGEASLRIGKEVNPKSTAYNRASNELTVSYLVFPGSADKPFGPPNLDLWRSKCEQFLNEIGGYAGQLHAWEDLTKPTPTPTPDPLLTGSLQLGLSGTSSPSATGSAASPVATPFGPSSLSGSSIPGTSGTDRARTLVPIKPTLRPKLQ